MQTLTGIILIIGLISVVFWLVAPKRKKKFKTPKSWPFDQPRNCAVFTHAQILDGSELLLKVTHDLDDHGWQFLGWSDAREKDVKIICLEDMVKRDSSLWQLADLPPGWRAWRRRIEDPWTRELNPFTDDEEV